MTTPPAAAAPLTVRRLSTGDRDLARRTFAALALAFDEPAKPLGDAALDRLLARPDFWVVTALAGDAVVGGATAHTLLMTRAEAAELFIYDVAVLAAHRRAGVGRALVTALHRAAADAGVGLAFVPADADDADAFEFYRALGGAPAAVTFFTFAEAPPRHPHQ